GQFAHWFLYAEPGERHSYLERALEPAFRGLVTPGRMLPRRHLVRRLAGRARIVVKEVAAVMATVWIYERYRPQTIVVYRHPCAVCLSERERDVDAVGSIREILAQPALRAVLGALADGVD